MARFDIWIISLLMVMHAAGAEGRTGAVVQYVTDGDTIAVQMKGKKKSVRLIGIYCPESSRNSKARRDSRKKGGDLNKIVSMGKRATRFVKGIIKKGDSVSLESDVQEKDRYGRLLAYVYLKDGRMLNDVIIRSGYASPMTIPPNVRHRDKFARSYKHARNNRLGLWGE